jgi:hypothetical protein
MLFQHNAAVGKHCFHGISGLCPVHKPLKSTIVVEDDCGRYGEGIVGTDLFNKTTISWCSGVGYDYIVHRQFLAASAGQSDFNHVILFKIGGSRPFFKVRKVIPKIWINNTWLPDIQGK